MARVGIGTDLEGFHAVRAALDAGRLRTLSVERNRLDHDDVGQLVSDAEQLGIDVSLVDDVRDGAVTGAPQGVVATAHAIEPISIKQAAGVDKPALLVFDHVEDPRNVGATARSAVAAGMTALVVSHNRAAPLGATAFKAAAGAFELIPVVMVSSIPDAMKRLSQLDVWTVGLDGSGNSSLFGLDLLDQAVAICVGAEGQGLSHLVRERCDVVVSIPMVGPTESLNASVAGALACYEVARVRGWVS